MSDRDRMARLFGWPLWIKLNVAYDTSGANDDGTTVGGVIHPPAPAVVGYVTPDRVVDMTIRRGRDNSREAVSAATLTVNLRHSYTFTRNSDAASVPLTTGMTVQVVITRAPANVGLDTALRFVGRITDLGDVEVDAGGPADTAVLPLTASGVLAQLGNMPLPDDPSLIFAGQSDWSIFKGVLNVAWQADPGLRVVPSKVDGSAGNTVLFRAPYGIADLDAAPARSTTPAVVWPWDMRGKTPADALGELAANVSGELIETKAGYLSWLTPKIREAAGPPLVIPTRYLLSPLTAAQQVGDLANRVAVTYGDPDAGGDRPSVTVSDPPSIRRNGQLPGPPIDTRLVDAGAARAIGSDYVGRYSRPFWRTPTVTVDVSDALEDGDTALVAQLATLDVGSLVQLDALPARAPQDPGVFWVEGITETFTSARWRLLLNLAPFGLLARPIEWQEVPAAMRWADVPADLTWLQSVQWQPDPYPLGTWRAQPSDLRYRWIDAPGPTWATA